MLIENYLIAKGFNKEKINDNIYFIKDSIRLEKCFNGFILSKPYLLISTVKQLKEIIK